MPDSRDLFDVLSTAKLQDFTDPELVELHMSAATHLEEAIVREYEGKSYNSDYEAELAETALDRFKSVREWKAEFYE